MQIHIKDESASAWVVVEAENLADYDFYLMILGEGDYDAWLDEDQECI